MFLGDHPQVNPDMIGMMDLFFPFIEYPHEEIREKARNIRKKHFGDLSIRQISEKEEGLHQRVQIRMYRI